MIVIHGFGYNKCRLSYCRSTFGVSIEYYQGRVKEFYCLEHFEAFLRQLSQLPSITDILTEVSADMRIEYKPVLALPKE